MPAKRSSNAHKASSQAPSAQPGGIAHDLVGVLLVVVAAALAASILMPSEAPLSRAMAEGLRLAFGEGALLAPVALAVFAVTMFLPTDNALVARVALGLALVVLSALSMLSITVPGAAGTPELVLEADAAASSGGYVGAGLAWLLLAYVGQVVGIVALVGLAVVGVVVCGFSVSDFATRVSSGMGHAAERLAQAREVGSQRRAAARAQRERLREKPETSVLEEAPTQLVGGAAPAAGETSFIGGRKTSVLRRRSSRPSEVNHETATMPLEGIASPAEEGAQAPAPEATLSTAGRKRHPRLSFLNARRGDNPQAHAEAEPSDAVEERPQGEVEGDVAPERADSGTSTSPRTLRRRTRAAAEPTASAQAREEATPEQTSGEDEVPFADSHVVDETAVPEFLRAAAQAKGRGRGRAAAAVAADSAARAASGSHPTPGRGQRARIAEPPATERPGDAADDFVLPPMSLLESNPNSASSASSDSELDRTARKLQSTLEEFGLTSRVSGWVAGPLVTTFKIEMGEGERVSKITNLQDDIQLSLASESVRIFAPIPGTSLVGIEIPNKRRQNVCLGDVLPYAQGGPLEFAIGRDSEGAPVVADLARMPHMLVAGTTGSGKSVLINAIIMSLIMRTTPEQVRLILVDPKRVEFSCYAGLPHLYVPVVTEPRQAASALQWAVTEMDRRLKVFERAGARDVKVYNRMVTDGKLADQENPPKPMPYLVIVIDELSDLMMVAGKDVEASVVRIAQLARAAGIHLVLATQRPSADVVTGLIKSNVDTRVALKVSSSIDSRVILDQTGAERLMGRGDMLFRKSGGVLRRVLGAYASDEEIESVVSFIRDQREPEYHDEILSAVVPGQPGAATPDSAEEDDPLVWEAAQVVVDSQLGSTSGLQRRLKVGYARAGRIMDNLEQKGVVGPPDGSKPREVLLDAEGLEELRHAEEAYREV